ncbi:MAG: LamG-like jellyroll fold domain-containing protein [Kiritimatiellia bacterium]
MASFISLGAEPERAPGESSLPEILIIGDSISLGYTPFLKEDLSGKAVVVHHEGNAQHTGTGLEKLDAWLGEGEWDIIHFNWGLWDLCYRHPESTVPGRRDKVNGTVTHTPEAYRENLEQLVARLKKTGATLIWANTTLVPEDEPGRYAGDERKYNQIAGEIMREHGIDINDLHAVTEAFPPEFFRAPGDVHYTPEGYQKIAEEVAKTLEKVLSGTKATQNRSTEVSIGDVWLYLPMDGTAEPTVGETVLQVEHRQWTNDSVTEDKNPTLTFDRGVAGRALDINEPRDGRPGDALTYILDVRTFPHKAGSMALWYKPEQVLEEEASWLFGMGWASFQARITGNRIGLHVTSDHRDAVYADLKPFADTWQDQWHLIVATWNQSTVRVFLDGQLIGERTDVKPLETAPRAQLDIGSLRPGGGRKTPVAYARGFLDDVVILSRPLAPEQVAGLYKAGQETAFTGFLDTVSTGALLSMPRHAYLRGEKADVTITPFAATEAGGLVAVFDGQRIELGRIAPRGGSEIQIDTAQLRPGTYSLIAELPGPKGHMISSEPYSLTVRERRQPEFPIGLGASFAASDEALALYEQIHISHLSSNGPQGDLQFWSQLDRAFAHGISLFPNFNILDVWGRNYESIKREPYFRKDAQGAWRVHPESGWKFLQTLVFADGSEDDHSGLSSASPFSPIAWNMMTERIDQIMSAAGDHPGLMAVSFQDEVPFRMMRDKETNKWKVGDYSYYAVEHFKEKSGLDAAAFPPDDPGGTVWPDNHPYLQWIKWVGLPGHDFTTVGLDDLYHRLGNEVHKYRTDVLIGNYSGGEYGQNDFVLDWNYPVIWEPDPGGWGRGGGYLDYVFDRHWARQHARPRKPLWALLGWWSGDMSGQPDWAVADFRLNTVWALAKGCKQIMWFYVGNDPLENEASGPFSHSGLRRELEQWSDFLHTKGPLFARLEKHPAQKVALLWSETNRAGHVRKTISKAEYYLVFAGLRNIGAEPDVITDQMIREGALDDYEALVLCGFNYSSESLWGEIRDFAALEGRTVFHDTTSELVPPGSVSLGLSWDETFEEKGGPRMRTRAVGKWANHLRPIVLPHLTQGDFQIEDPSGQTGAHLLWAGNTPYVFILNTDMDHSREVRVRFRHDGSVAYHLATGDKRVLRNEDGTVTFSEVLPPGGWAPFVLPPAAIAALNVEADADEGNVQIRFSLRDDANRIVPAAWPVRIELLDPRDRSTAYIRQTSTEVDGKGRMVISLGRLVDPAGRWTVQVTDELTGKITKKSIDINWTD